jgi:hypothetical protein
LAPLPHLGQGFSLSRQRISFSTCSRSPSDSDTKPLGGISYTLAQNSTGTITIVENARTALVARVVFVNVVVHVVPDVLTPETLDNLKLPNTGQELAPCRGRRCRPSVHSPRCYRRTVPRRDSWLSTPTRLRALGIPSDVVERNHASHSDKGRIKLIVGFASIIRVVSINEEKVNLSPI